MTYTYTGNIVGIDPGQASGAISVFSPDGKIIYVGNLPVTKVCKKKKKGKSVKTLLDGHALKEMLTQFNIKYACVEKVHAMNKNGRIQGVVSTASFMEAFGVIKGILIGLNIPFILVSPKKWKKEILKISKCDDKKVSINYVKNMYPDVTLKTKKAKNDNHNWADAVCIGEYGYKFFLKKEK